MDSLVIEKGAFHSTEASSTLPVDPASEDGIWVMEIESPPMKTDLVRLKDAYGRAGTSYEGSKNMVFNPKDIFKIEETLSGKIFKKNFHDSIFTVGNGSEIGRKKFSPDTLVCVIAKNQD